jgi:drug/metabolite transporter (DMT)-like permease
VLALAGVVIVLKTGGTAWPVPEGLPDWLALAGGFCFALTNILLLKLNRVPGESRVLAMFGGGTLMARPRPAWGWPRAWSARRPRPAWAGWRWAWCWACAF